ncbi:hypothetical protein GIS00_11910 [Nakamurella sp. YIM 132087]|uniref:SH3 domain-containing protein n=1 Tax=Nakamurella alba TaxID=2665158 RepID=A0A7K1FKL4_9ACTN|nr:SH3 domain-containing protein [Nakamurella alba]MTD14648.1 hypothetical protein [Nakamurella alba]
MEPFVAAVAADHEIPDWAPISVRVGDHVQVGDRDTTWPAFVFVTVATGKGWVPERLLDDQRPVARVLQDYDTRELPVSAGDRVVVTIDDAESGWCWCTNDDGRAGWVPRRVLVVDTDAQ